MTRTAAIWLLPRSIGRQRIACGPACGVRTSQVLTRRVDNVAAPLPRLLDAVLGVVDAVYVRPDRAMLVFEPVLAALGDVHVECAC